MGWEGRKRTGGWEGEGRGEDVEGPCWLSAGLGAGAPISKFWDPLNISQTGKATICKFGTHIGCGQFLPMDHKLAPKWAWPGVRDPISKVSGPPQYFANGKSYDLPIWHAYRSWAVLPPGAQIGPKLAYGQQGRGHIVAAT